MIIARKHAGFTLVELAIVLMIIGLLIGGVLKGQELINNARITSIVRQLTSYEAAITTFRDSYNALPGDIKAPGTRLPNCVDTNCTTAGNEDYVLDFLCTGINCGVGPQEIRRFWVHLSKANLISGIDTSYTGTPNAWGTDFPSSPLGGGFMPQSYAIAASNPVPAFSTPVGMVFKNTVTSTPNSVITPHQAAALDRKMDDGKPFSGSIVAAIPSWTCFTGQNSTDSYDESASTISCSLIIKMQN